jgi:hypothetical protein
MFGIIFIAFIYPMIESGVNVIITYLEMVKGKFTVEITKMNLQISKLANPEEEQSVTHAIGFAIPTEEEEEAYEEDI